MLKANYNCSQSELYTIAILGWNSCLQHRPQIAGFRPKYTEVFIADKLEAIQIAKNLPGEAERNYNAIIHHIQLTEQAKSCRELYQKLKRYIIGAFPLSQQQASLNAAGQEFFTAASDNNWDAVESLMSTALNFITAHSAQLLANDNMYAQFPAIFADASNGFSITHQAFLDDEEAAKIATETKQLNTNQVHADLMSMFLDAQEALRGQEAILSQFIFEHSLILVRGAGTAGVRGSVKNGTTNQPIADATITIGFDDYTTTTDIEGHYQISPAAAGTYSVTVTATGFQPFNIPNHVIITGTISSLNILLVPVVEP